MIELWKDSKKSVYRLRNTYPCKNDWVLGIGRTEILLRSLLDCMSSYGYKWVVMSHLGFWVLLHHGTHKWSRILSFSTIHNTIH